MAASSSNVRSDRASSNIFTAQVYDEEYWNGYLASRPKYSKDFYDLIYAYHEANNEQTASSLALAHDVGTGPGQVAAVLARRVSRVIASDANFSHLQVAGRRLQDLYADGRVEFVHTLGEELATKCSDKINTADMVVAGESLALMDRDRAIAGFAELLKPGGSLAFWYYGRPIFVEDPKCQEIYNKIVNKLFGAVIKSNGNAAKTSAWKRATELMATMFDNIHLPAEQWADVQRYKWNSRWPMPFYDDSACDFDVERTSVVTPAEKMIEKEDLDFWAEDWNVAEVKRFVDTNLPEFKQTDEEDKEVAEWFEELSEAMGGKEAKKHITWPVALILATKQ